MTSCLMNFHPVLKLNLMRGLASTAGPPSGAGKPPAPEPALPPGPAPPAPAFVPPLPVVAPPVVPEPVAELPLVGLEPPVPDGTVDDAVGPPLFSDALQLQTAAQDIRPAKARKR